MKKLKKKKKRGLILFLPNGLPSFLFVLLTFDTSLAPAISVTRDRLVKMKFSLTTAVLIRLQSFETDSSKPGLKISPILLREPCLLSPRKTGKQ